MVCVGITCCCHFAVFSFLIMKKSAQKEQKAKEAVEEALQEKSEEGSDNTEEIMTPGADSGNWRGEPTNQVVFEETDDQVFVTVPDRESAQGTVHRRGILATAPMSRLFVRTGFRLNGAGSKKAGNLPCIKYEGDFHGTPGSSGGWNRAAGDRGDCSVICRGKTVIIDPGHQGSGDSTRNPLDRVRHPRKAR